MCASAAERDRRGYAADTGWVHATAHTADVLRFLARSPKLPVAGQARLLAAIPAGLRDALRDPERAGPVMVALLLAELVPRLVEIDLERVEPA